MTTTMMMITILTFFSIYVCSHLNGGPLKYTSVSSEAVRAYGPFINAAVLFLTIYAFAPPLFLLIIIYPSGLRRLPPQKPPSIVSIDITR